MISAYNLAILGQTVWTIWLSLFVMDNKQLMQTMQLNIFISWLGHKKLGLVFLVDLGNFIVIWFMASGIDYSFFYFVRSIFFIYSAGLFFYFHDPFYNNNHFA